MDEKDVELTFALAECLGFHMFGNGASWDEELQRPRVIAGSEVQGARASAGIIDTPGNGILFDPLHCEGDLKRVEIKLGICANTMRDRAYFVLNFINEIKKITESNENKSKASKKAPEPESNPPDSVPGV